MRFFHITVPLISPTLFRGADARLNSLKQFDTIYLLIKPSNPAYRKSTTLMVMFYREAFERNSTEGYASAIVMWSFAIMVLTIISSWRRKSWSITIEGTEYDDKCEHPQKTQKPHTTGTANTSSAVLIIGSFLMIFPFVWMILTFKPGRPS